MTTKLIKKRCDRCGHVVMTRHRRNCRQPRFGKGSYACWGNLVPVMRKPRPPKDAVDLPPGMGIGWVLSEDADHARAEKARGLARTEMAKLAVKIAERQREIAQASKAINRWQRKIAYYSKRANMTTEQFVAERQARLGRKAQKPPSRGIVLPPDELHGAVKRP